MRGTVCMLLMLFASLSVYAQEPTDEEAKAWQQRRQAEFARYELVQQSPTGELAVPLEPKSLLNWSNPIRKTPAGAVFLWTLGGRPQMIASTYPVVNGVEQELTSLADLPLLLRQDGQPVHRFQPGIEWKNVPDADPPVTSRTLRLTQMRRIAERLRVTGGDDRTFDARMLTQPVYRSPAKSPTDAALFVFVQGTDPEAVLLLEAVEDRGWRYALARMTRVAIWADLDEQRVWDLPASWKQPPPPDGPFHLVPLPGVR